MWNPLHASSIKHPQLGLRPPPPVEETVEAIDRLNINPPYLEMLPKEYAKVANKLI